MAKKYVHLTLGLILPLLITVNVFSPALSVLTVPVMCVAAYYLGVCVKPWLIPLFALLNFVSSALISGFGLFSAGGSVVMLALTVPAIVRRRLTVWWEIALCAAVCLIAVCASVFVWALCEGLGASDCIAGAYEKLSSDPIVYALSKRHYSALTESELGHIKLSEYDELYTSEIMREYGKHLFSELEGNTLWYLTGYGVFAGGVAATGAKAFGESMNEVFLNPSDTEKGICGQTQIKDLRLGKTYLLGAVLPALLFAFLAFYDPMREVVRTVVNVMITLPTTLCGITLLYHSALRFGGKAKIAALAVFWLIITASAVFYEWGMIIIGFIGLSDAVINIRRCLDWALSEK